jgi:serine/threonine-protein kinase HipA
LGASGAVRLAPFYDLASILPYRAVDLQKVKLAMKIGGEYRLQNIGLHQWKKLATETRVDEGGLLDRITEMAASLPDRAETVERQIAEDGLSHPTIARLGQRLKTRAAACLRAQNAR